jgi:hypothetical protein
VSPRAVLFALATALTATLGAAPLARADVLSALQDLAERPVHPAPLIPTRLPTRFGPLADVLVERGAAIRGGGYSLSFARRGTRTQMVLVRGDYPSVRALHRRRAGLDRVRPMRVRGHKGELRTDRHGGGLDLVWTERGRVYELASPSKGKLSAKDLLAAAKSLDPLARAWEGSFGPDALQSALVVTTAHTVSAYIDWVGMCNGQPGTYAGSGLGLLLPIRSFTFRAANLPSGTSSAPWTNQVSGIVGASTILLSLQARTTFQGIPCDTGGVSFVLTPLRPLH